jgi:hypothetical protein
VKALKKLQMAATDLEAKFFEEVGRLCVHGRDFCDLSPA